MDLLRLRLILTTMAGPIFTLRVIPPPAYFSLIITMERFGKRERFVDWPTARMVRSKRGWARPSAITILMVVLTSLKPILKETLTTSTAIWGMPNLRRPPAKLVWQSKTATWGGGQEL